MSEIDKLLSNPSAAEEEKTNNAKYVKLTYTKSGTVVLSATNNKEEQITIDELSKFVNF